MNSRTSFLISARCSDLQLVLNGCSPLYVHAGGGTRRWDAPIRGEDVSSKTVAFSLNQDGVDNPTPRRGGAASLPVVRRARRRRRERLARKQSLSGAGAIPRR